MYVRTCVSVKLRNVNLRYRLGMSIRDQARTGYWIRALQDDVGTIFLGDGGRGGQRGWPFATYKFSGAKCLLNAADGWQLWEKSAHRRNQESDRRTRRSSKVESTYWRFLHKTSIKAHHSRYCCLVLFFGLPFRWATPDTCAARPISEWRLARREASYVRMRIPCTRNTPCWCTTCTVCY